MSYTEIYRITKAGNTKFEGEIRNAHRGAMAVWTFLEDKYLPPLIKYGQNFSRVVCSNDEEIQPLWDLADDTRLTDSERICLLSTFDNVMVLKADIPKLTKAFREFPGNTSLTEQADLIESITSKNFEGICWNQTSVNADIPAKNVNGKYWNLFDKVVARV